MSTQSSFGDLISYDIGGGWGEEYPGSENVEVRVIRGADFPEVDHGSVSATPIRFETPDSVHRRRLQAGDIILEISGGTRERPTGRSLLMTDQLLRNEALPVIPASFCRLLRPNPELVVPAWLHYALKDLWSRGLTWRFQNQSTGISNFQYPLFATTFKLEVPDLSTQRAIAEVLGALDDKIAANRRVVELADELVSATVGSNLREEVPLWEAVQVAFGEPFAGAHFSEEGNGRPLIRIRDLKSQACAVWTTEARPNEIVVNPGEVLVGMDAEFTATRWSGPSGLLNQRVLLAGSDQLGKPIVRESLKAPLARLERSKSGTTVIHLNKADLLRESVLIPAAEDLAPLRAIVDPVWDRAVAAEREDQVLASTRDELLPLLMSGRITVGAASSRVEEVV